MVCVRGGIYNDGHVERLSGMLSLSEEYEIHVIRESNKPGWFAKIDLFEPGRFTGRVLYLDLDVTVVGDLGPIAWHPGSFNIIRDYISLGFNSSVMSWDAGAVDHIYNMFRKSHMKRLNGDQDWIALCMQGREANTFPKRWCVSYRKDVEPTGLVPPDARVVVYHGQPKPWDIE